MVAPAPRPKNFNLIYALGALARLLGFGLLTIPIVLGWTIPGDAEGLAFAESLRNEPLSFFIQLLSFITSAIPAALLCSGLCAAEFWRVRKLNLAATWPLIALLGYTLFNLIARSLIGRLPPQGGYTIGNLLPELWTGFQIYAYPSGHAGSALIAYWSLAAVLWPYLRLRRRGILIALLVSLGSGLGRVYLGVHWPTDVLGGYLLSGAWLAVGMLVRQRYNQT
jgi:undecaprenyl-diphosphatase